MTYAILCDLDDTLVPNAYSYYAPQLEMAALITWDLGYHSQNPVNIINRATEIQVQAIKDSGYIAKHNFPMSYVDVYIELCKKIEREPNEKIKSAIAMAGIKYFLNEYQIYPGVIDALKKIPKLETKWMRIIVTRGDRSVQQYKIDNTQLGPYFDHIKIVDAKTKQTYLDIVNEFDLDPAHTVMVGDSLRNDIIPALEAGLYGFQVVAENSTDWEKSLGHIGVVDELANRYFKIKSFPEIIDYLDKKLIHYPN